MTDIFKAGEHVKIVRTDEGYADTLGDQTGLVGTVVLGKSSGGVHVTFPHTGSAEFYYVASEIERASGTPSTEPVPAPPAPPFTIGDRVKVVNYHRVWDGTIGVVKRIHSVNNVEITNSAHLMGLSFPTRNLELSSQPAPIPAPKFAVGDWVQVNNYTSGVWEGIKGKVKTVGAYDLSDGYNYVILTHNEKPFRSGGFAEKYLRASTAPFEPKFKVGDWVEVTGCCNDGRCNGSKWQVKEQQSDFRGYYTVEKDKRTANYGERYLKATTKPFTPKFKVGDWIEITNWGSSFNGTKLQVSKVPALAGDYYKFEGKEDGYGFREQYLKDTDAPHWTDTKPVGAVAQILYSGGGTNRIIVKVADNNWLHIYQNGDGKAAGTSNRSNSRTRTLFGNIKNIEWQGAAL